MDLAEYYAAGRVDALLDYIDGLPGACRLNEAISNDPEAAEHIAQLPKPKDPWSPRLSEFTLMHRMMRDAIHELKSLRQTLVGVNGGHPKQEQPFPVPRTEVDRAIERLERQWAEDFLGQFGFDPSDI